MVNNKAKINKYSCNIAELNAILYYADFLSLKAISTPVTDTCKYFFIHKTPINSAYIADVEPIYDENNEYFKESLSQYTLLRDKVGEDAVMSFIDTICSIGVIGCVGGRDMLRCIHRYSTRGERNSAIKKYEEWRKSLKYKHLTKDEEYKPVIKECSKYVAHVDKSRGIHTEFEVTKDNKNGKDK